MNTTQRLLSNTALAFFANILTKAGNALLFIAIGRMLGPTESGIFSLGTTYFTFVVGLSAFGLHEVMVRELASRRVESVRYLVNFLTLRLILTLVTYGFLVLGLWLFAPYSVETSRVILILSLAALPEAAFTIFQSLFEAHERLAVLLTAAATNSAIKLGGGLWLLHSGATTSELVWIVPAAGAISLLVFAPSIVRLISSIPQGLPGRLDWAFMKGKMVYMPSFFFIHLMTLIDYQADALIISIKLGENELGYYAAATTILLAFNLMPPAIRAALYPLMSRYHRDAPDKLGLLYDSIGHYLAALVLPLAAGVTLIAEPLVEFIFGSDFGPAIPVLRITIWAIVFLFLVEPHARVLLIYNKQREAARIMSLTTALNIILNLMLIPLLGINGAGIARLAASAVLYISFYSYTYFGVLPSRQPFSFRAILATLIMAVSVFPLRNLVLPVPIAVGIVVYIMAAKILGVIPEKDLVYWRDIYRRST